MSDRPMTPAEQRRYSEELLGLAWDDIDLEGGYVTVNAQLGRQAGEWVRVAPKAARRVKRLGLDPETIDVLRAHQLRQAAERTAEWQFWGLLFVTPAGQPWGRSEILRAFHAALEVAGVRRRRFHDLRHSNQTILEDLGIDEKTRMDRAGHATKRISRHYSHGSEAQQRAASVAIARAVS